MIRKQPIRVIEIHLKKSQKNPKFCHVIAVLFPCSHHLYLGVSKTPKDMEGKFIRVQDVTIWEPTTFSVMDKALCKDCPIEDYWVHSIPQIEDMKEENLYED